jgi:ATP-dependent Clp protease adapter protein ClpS
MQEGDPGEGERQRGRTITVARPKPKPKQDRKEDVDKEPSWRVLLHNDDVHTFDYVTMAIVKVVKTITRKKAHRITVQAHSMGTATVTTTWKQMAKTMCLKLQKFGLTSSIAPDSSGGA